MKNIKVAVMNSSKEITQMLEEIIQDAGHTTCSVFTYEFKNQEDEFDQYVQLHKPEVILYDIAPPYKENYQLFHKLSMREAADQIPFVLTSTNKDALESIVGPTSTHELVGKPYDLQEIIEALERAYKRKKSNNNEKMMVNEAV